MVLEQIPALTAGKLRRLRRNRRFTGLAYWAAWALAGAVFVVLLAGGIAGLAAG